MKLLRRFFHDLFTGVNGVTFDIGRVSWFWTQLAIMAAAIANWWHGSVIPLLELGGALGANTALHGAALGFKASTEPGLRYQPPILQPQQQDNSQWSQSQDGSNESQRGSTEQSQQSSSLSPTPITNET